MMSKRVNSYHVKDDQRNISITYVQGHNTCRVYPIMLRIDLEFEAN